MINKVYGFAAIIEEDREGGEKFEVEGLLSACSISEGATVLASHYREKGCTVTYIEIVELTEEALCEEERRLLN